MPGRIGSKPGFPLFDEGYKLRYHARSGWQGVARPTFVV